MPIDQEANGACNSNAPPNERFETDLRTRVGSRAGCSVGKARRPGALHRERRLRSFG